jgi:hypothetical protein
MCQHLYQADNGQVPIMVQKPHAGFLQFIPPYAAADHIRKTMFESLQDKGAMVIAGGFTGYYHDAGSLCVHYPLSSRSINVVAGAL